MPRPAGRAKTLKFKRKTGKFDPVATFGKRDAFSGYLATTKGTERRHANEFNSIRNALSGAWEDEGYSKARITRKKQEIIKLFPHYSAVRSQIDQWAWEALARHKCITVAELKESVLEPTERRRKTKATGEWKPMALSELWKPIQSPLKAKNVAKPTQTVPQGNLGTAIDGTKSSIKPNILANAKTTVPAQLKTKDRSVSFSNSSHPPGHHPRIKPKRLPKDVRRQYLDSEMWHTSADRARAERERHSGIDAIYMSERNCDLVQWERECAAEAQKEAQVDQTAPHQPTPIHNEAQEEEDRRLEEEEEEHHQFEAERASRKAERASRKAERAAIRASRKARAALRARTQAQVDQNAPQPPTQMPTVPAPVDTKVALAAAADLELPPNPPVGVTETRRTPYERIQRRSKQRTAKAARREEEERFFDAAIGMAEDERTEMAKSEDNLCPFKRAVNEKDSLQPRRKPA